MCITLFFLIIFLINLEAQLAAGHSKFLGNIWSAGIEPGNFPYYWNQVTPGNSGKWASCEQARDDLNYWLWLDRCYDSSIRDNLVFKEHCLFWGHSSGEPSWMSSLSASEQLSEAVEWIQAITERYTEIDLIDVVNEPLHAPPSYTEALGGEGSTGWDWVIWCFETTRQYSNSKLLINEYNVLAYNDTCDDYLALINLLQARGLIDGIGIQGHSLESVNINTIINNLDKLAATGLPIYISEYEVAIADDNQQLAVYQEQFPVFWEHPAVDGVTLWGYIEGDMWRADGYLVSADGTKERPALKWLREYLGGDPNETPPPTATPTPEPTPDIMDCTDITEWDANTVYGDEGGIRVVYNNRVYENNWYSQGDNPEENSGEYAVWTVIGTCDSELTPGPETPTPTPTPLDTPTPTQAPPIKTGDTNDDGQVNIVDALLVAQYYVGLDPDVFVIENADTNCDGSVNIVDALLIAQYYVGLITGFC